MRLFLALILVGLASAAQAGQTIDQLGAGSTPAGDELMPTVQGGGNTAVTLPLTTIYDNAVGVAADCGLSTGAGAIRDGTIKSAYVVTTLAAANAAITNDYCGGLENLSNTSAQIPTIAAAGGAGFPVGWFTDLCNVNSGLQTLTPASGTIGGAASYPIPGGTLAFPNCVRVIVRSAGVYQIIQWGEPASAALNLNNTFTGTNAFSNTLTTNIKGFVNCVAVNTAGVLGPANAPCGTGVGFPMNTPAAYVSNRFYIHTGSISNVAAAGGGAAVANTMYCTIGGVLASVTIKAMGLKVATAGAGLSQLALYRVVSPTSATLVDTTATFTNAAAANELGALNNTTDALLAGVAYLWCVNQNSTPIYTGGSFNSGWQYYGGATMDAMTNTVASSRLGSISFGSTFGCTTNCTNGFPSTLTLPSTDQLNPKMPLIVFQVN